MSGYDAWKTREPDSYAEDRDGWLEEAAFLEMLAAHECSPDFDPEDLFDFWESEQ